MKRAITRDVTAWLENLVSEANDAAAKGDIFAVTKKLKSGHDKPHKVIGDESGVLLVEEEMVATMWSCCTDRKPDGQNWQRSPVHTKKTARWKGTNEPGHSA